MLQLFETYDESKLRYLSGGRTRGNDYFIGIVGANNCDELFFGRLINNFQSQKQPVSHPAGYLPFLIGGETWDFDLQSQTFSVRRFTSVRNFQGNTVLFRS